MNIIKSLSVCCLAVTGMMGFTAAPASAQATRTWVSGVGDDVNPCSRTAPCKTFAGAISKTAAGGEINCLDPGGYGTLTITKSITVDCTGTFGSSLNSGGINGFVVNDSLAAVPGTAEVRLRGLSINGAGTTPGLNGIRFLSGKSLVVEDVFIHNQKGGAGILFAPQQAARELYVVNTTIADGGTGIAVQPTGAAGSARVGLNNVRLLNNSADGLLINTTGNTSVSGVFVTIEDSEMAGNVGNGVSVIAPAGNNSATVSMNENMVMANGTGISANGNNTTMRVADTTIVANTTGVSIVNSATASSYGDNRLDGNGADGAFTAGILPKR